MGGPVKQMVDGTTLAVGDAAGLVMPSNGGGIIKPSSLAVLRQRPSLSTWPTTHRSPHMKTGFVHQWGQPLKNSLRSKNLGYAFMRGDVLTELILRCLGPIGVSSEPWNARSPYGCSERQKISSHRPLIIGVFK